MKLANWIKPANSPGADLKQQLDAANAARATAWAEVDRAQSAFDVDGSPSAEKALIEARAAAERANLHVGRAQRLLDEAHELEKQRQRAERVSRREELRRSLEPAALESERAPLAQEEADALHALAKVRVRRRQLESDIFERERELDRITAQLGEQPPFRDIHTALRMVNVPTQAPVRQRVEVAMAKLPRDSHERHYLERQLMCMTDSW